jgi:uncharacterized membrane protein
MPRGARSVSVATFLPMAILAVGLGLFTLRYAMPHPPVAPDNVTRNPFATPFLPIHALLSAIALIVGPFQFLTTRKGRRPWHRACGRIYVAVCLLSAPVGLLLALGATTGPIASAGFGILAILWFLITLQGYRAALAGRFAEHRRWMIRSYALTFGAVTLRLYLAVAIATQMDFAPAYRAISFLAWVPNLLLVEWWLRRGPPILREDKTV